MTEKTTLIGDSDKLVISLVSIILLSVMNGTMFNVAVPTIAVDFGLTPSEVSWVVTAYAMFFAIGAVTYGKLADLYPVRRLITVGLLLFASGSVLGFIGTSYPVVIVGRIMQASGGAAIPALAMIVSTRFFPPHKRGLVLGYIASGVALGSGLGPILGGVLTQFFSWHFLFLISAMGILAIPFLRKYLPEEEKKAGTFDYIGAVVFALAVAFVLIFINLGKWYFLVTGVLCFVFFVIHIKRAKAPFIQIDLLRNTRYSLLLISAFLIFGSMMSTLFVVPLMLKNLNALQAGTVGLVLFPGAMSAALLGIFSGRLVDRIGSVVVLKGAVGLMFLGVLGLSAVAGHQPWMVATVLVLPYIGFASVQSSLAKYVSLTLDPKLTGIGMGIYNLFTFISGAVSTAFAGFFLELPMQVGWNPFNQVAFVNYINVYMILALVLAVSLGLLYYAGREFASDKARA